MRAHIIRTIVSGSTVYRRIRPLAQLFAVKYAKEKKLPIRLLDREAENLIATHDWKNDLAALAATIRNAVVMAEGEEINESVIRFASDETIEAELGRNTRMSDSMRPLLGYTLAEMEREYILLTVECCAGNRTRAADVLDISVRTLRNKLELYSRNGIPIPVQGTYERMLEKRRRQFP